MTTHCTGIWSGHSAVVQRALIGQIINQCEGNGRAFVGHLLAVGGNQGRRSSGIERALLAPCSVIDRALWRFFE